MKLIPPYGVWLWNFGLCANTVRENSVKISPCKTRRVTRMRGVTGRNRGSAGQSPRDSPIIRRGKNKMTDRIILVCTLLLAGVYFWATEQIPALELGDPLGPKAFPRMLGIGLLIAAAMLLAEMLRDRRKVKAGDKSAASPPLTWESHDWVVVGVAVWTGLYVLVFEHAGYMLATAIYLLAMTFYFNRGRWVMNVSTSLLFSIGSYFSFTKLLGVTLARGILPF